LIKIIAIFTCALFVFSCSSGPQKKRRSYKSKHSQSHKKRAGKKSSPKTAQKSSQKTNPRARSEGRRQNLVLPSIVNSKDQSSMVLVDSGKYFVTPPSGRMTSSGAQVNLLAFYIDRFEITVAQFKKFNSKYNETRFISSCPKCPAVGVTWSQARDYCFWADKILPTEAQWEAAAQGPVRRIWPWGNQFDTKKANLMGIADGIDGVANVGSYPSGVAPSGAQDMTGNVWEWVASSSKSSLSQRLVKGGGWRTQQGFSLISARNWVDPKMQNPTFGFRCAKKAKY
jgi:formylglycine-generating enzyme